MLPLSWEGHCQNGLLFCKSGNKSTCGNKTPLGTPRPFVLAGQILGPLFGEFAGAQSRGLTNFDQVAVGVPHVTANLSTAIDRRRHKLGPF